MLKTNNMLDSRLLEDKTERIEKDSLVLESAYEAMRDTQCAMRDTINFGERSLLSSFKFASQGLVYAFKTQRNLRIQIGIGVLVVLAGILFKVSSLDMAVLAIVIMLVLICELINTALEFTLDFLNGKKFHPTVKVAKDVVAAAVLLTSVNAAIVGVIIFLRYV